MAASIKTDGLQVLRRIQPEVAFGLLTCDANLRVSSLFSARETGATVLSAITLGLCLVKNWSYKVPVIVTSALLLYTIKALFDRIILRQQARLWRPIFENVITGKRLFRESVRYGNLPA